jgi:hypothetical protein
MGKIKVIDKLPSFVSNNVNAMDRVLNKMSIDIERIAKLTVPVKTGQLKASGHHTRNGLLNYKVFFNKEYAAHIEFGTKPHVIVATNKKVLADKKAGVIFGKRVMHPGFKGRFFLTNAVKQVLSRDVEYFRKEVQTIKV